MKIKVGILALHPIPYQDKIWEILNKKSKNNNIIIFDILFLDRLGESPFYSFEVKSIVDYRDYVKLNYPHKFLKNLSPFKLSSFLGRVNPSLLRYIPQYDVLLIHGYTQVSMIFAALYGKLLGKKLIFRGETVDLGNTLVKKFLKKIFVSKFLAMFDVVMYSCSKNKKVLEKLGVSEDKMIFMPSAVDNEFFRHQFLRYKAEREKIRKEIGLNEDDIVILTVGRLVEVKRPFDIIDALLEIKMQNSQLVRKIKTLFIGDGPLRKDLIKKARSYGLEENLIITGFKRQSEIGKFYTISDIFILPSSQDPSPKVLHEAMNFELPIIVTDVVGTAEDLVKHNYNGFIVKVGDIKSMANFLYFLIMNEQHRKNFGKRSYEIIKKWNFEKCADAILSACAQMRI